MAAKNTSGARRARMRAANDEEFRPIEAKRVALEAAEREAQRKPRRTVEATSRASNVLARPQPSRGRDGRAGGASASAPKSKTVRASRSTGKRAARPQRQPSQPARPVSRRATAARKGSTARKTSRAGKTGGARKASAKRVSEKLWQLAERKSARRAQPPAWQAIEHHDQHGQTNAPPVTRARIPSAKRGDRRLTPAEKQRAGE